MVFVAKGVHYCTAVIHRPIWKAKVVEAQVCANMHSDIGAVVLASAPLRKPFLKPSRSDPTLLSSYGDWSAAAFILGRNWIWCGKSLDCFNYI